MTSAFIKTLGLLNKSGIRESSRNGPVLSLPGPLVVEFKNPCNRVLFSSLRDANPFFHLFESIWMLAGKNDVAFVKQFNSNIENYSDDGLTFHGAYGHRWRHWARDNEGPSGIKTFDQIPLILKELKKEGSRRAVLSMWNPTRDLGRNGLDLPCNTHIYFRMVGGGLNMTVCNRSNDIVWGMFGANAVHMSLLQEYIALELGVGIGSYFQISNNAHVYLDVLDYKGWTFDGLVNDLQNTRRFYRDGRVLSIPLGGVVEVLNIYKFLTTKEYIKDPPNKFLKEVVIPMYTSWGCRKSDPNSAEKILLSAIQMYGNIDWLVAGLGWLQRRKK